MAQPSGIDVPKIKDVLGLSKVIYSATVDLDGDGSIIIILHAGLDEIGSIVIENLRGNLDFHYWNRIDHEYQNDPTTSFTMWASTPGSKPTYPEED